MSVKHDDIKDEKIGKRTNFHMKYLADWGKLEGCLDITTNYTVLTESLTDIKNTADKGLFLPIL